MQTVVSHPTGNRNVRAIISSFAKAGLLAEFFTTLSIDSKAGWLKLIPAKFRYELKRRSFPIPAEKIKSFPSLEVARMVFAKSGISYPIRHELGWASVDSIYHLVDRKTAGHLQRLKKYKNINAVYAYEDGALFSFRQAKNMGIKCIYDLPIAYWETTRKLMDEESRRVPAWAVTLGGSVTDSAQKVERKSEELNLADVIISPSKFVESSLPEWTKNKQIIMSPFGSPDCVATEDVRSVLIQKAEDRPLRILFVGSMGQRKGLADLFAAMHLLKSSQFELVVMGTLRAPMQFYKNEYGDFKYEPGRPHEKVLELMRSCDIFCLPSIVEGRALVMQEAMSQGLPLIITPNTGGEDLIIDEKTGFLVPIRSPEKIAEKLTWFNDNRDKIPEMGLLAKEHAARYSWESYGQKVINSLMEL
ncbi:MAG: glycosyltransferase family 4 protein [Ginsengibacter sp.]